MRASIMERGTVINVIITVFGTAYCTKAVSVALPVDVVYAFSPKTIAKLSKVIPEPTPWI